VQIVQSLINAVPPAKGGPYPLLGVDGLCGPMTCGAIRRFHADGQIDGEFGNKAVLRGWVNLDALYAVAIASFPRQL
jgi:hypothetical protein